MIGFQYDPMFSAIAVTGADCGGKSKFVEKARPILAEARQRALISGEVATPFIQAGFDPTKGWKDSLAFQRYLLEETLYQEELYYRMYKEENSGLPGVMLCDRGALDAGAYIGREALAQVAAFHNTRISNLRSRYKAVIHLVTAADGAEEFYTLENNPARKKMGRTPEEARALDKLTQKIWWGHPHLIVIDNSTGFEEKISRAINALHRVLHMPNAEEQERRWKFQDGTPPEDAVAIDIVQDYLISLDPSVERRVRMSTSDDGGVCYYYTEKAPTQDPDKRRENDNQITHEEYARLLGQKDLSLATIRKRRWTFVYKGRTMEHNLYSAPIRGLKKLEIEKCPMGDVVEFPPSYTGLVETTGDKGYSDYSIASGKYPDQEPTT